MESNGNSISGVAAIIIVAIGILIFVLLFIFAKRQIMRFALKSHQSLHTPIGHDAPKYMRQEIERRFNIIKDIKCEPKLLKSDDSDTNQNFNHYYRMKAVDSLAILDSTIMNVTGDKYKMRPFTGHDLRVYLIKLTKNDGPLSNCDTKTIHQFVDCYNSARHEPTPVFSHDDYHQFMSLLNVICNSINDKNTSSTGKSSSSVTRPKDTAAQIVINGKTQVSIVNNSNENIETHETSV